MRFIDLVKKRESVRSFSSQKVEDDALQYILEAGRLAPSAKNLQPWYFIVINETEMLDKIKSCYPRDWISQAPIIIVVCGNHDKGWKRADNKDHTDIDVAIAIDHMTLAATEIGLGTCWVCSFDATQCSEILQLPNNIEPIALLPIGYSDKQPNAIKNRKSLSEIVLYNRFSL